MTTDDQRVGQVAGTAGHFLRDWKPARDDGLIAGSSKYSQYNAWSWSAGALNTNTKDLGTFFNAFRRGKLLKSSTTQLLRGHSSSSTVRVRDLFFYGGTWKGISTFCVEADGTMMIALMNGTGLFEDLQGDVLKQMYTVVRGARAT